MASLREMRLHIRSVRNISQVTRALQTVSASKVRRAQAAVMATRPYANKALEVLDHLADRRSTILHPMLVPQKRSGGILVIVVSGDRGLAGAYNAAVVRESLLHFAGEAAPVHYLVIGRKGREMLQRAGVPITAEFSHLPAAPSYNDVSAIGRLAIEEYTSGKADQVFIVFTKFINMLQQRTMVQQLLPVPDVFPSTQAGPEGTTARAKGAAPGYIFEPGQTQLLDFVINRLVSLEIYECILESLASEHAARMVMMRNATDNAVELITGLQLVYNKMRQQNITGDLLDIAAGTEALAAASRQRGK
jgi:F-type H+-transporting ATPase subunit gamma